MAEALTKGLYGSPGCAEGAQWHPKGSRKHFKIAFRKRQATTDNKSQSKPERQDTNEKLPVGRPNGLHVIIFLHMIVRITMTNLVLILCIVRVAIITACIRTVRIIHTMLSILVRLGYGMLFQWLVLLSLLL